MEILGRVTEDGVLECFVVAERDPERYGECVRDLLEKHGRDVPAVSETRPPLIAVGAPGSYLVLLDGTCG